jgi:hypothetical protein
MVGYCRAYLGKESMEVVNNSLVSPILINIYKNHRASRKLKAKCLSP